MQAHIKTMKKISWFFGVISVLSGIGYWLYYSATPMMAPDSTSYLTFCPSRTPAYPIFLWICHALFGSYDLLPSLQLGLLFSGILYLTVQFYGLSRSWLLSLGLWLLLAGNIEIVKYAFLMLTESLTITLLLFSLGILCRFVATRSIGCLVVLSTFLGLAILIRPASYGWVLGLLFAGIGLKAFLPKFGYKYAAGLLCLPLAVILFLGSVFNYAQHGFFSTQSFLGEMLIGKVGFLAEKQIPTQQPHVMAFLSNYSTPVRVLLKKAPSWRIQYLLSSVYADQYRYSPFARSLAEKMLEGSDVPQALNKKRTQLAIELICAKPFAYLHNVLINYIALWQVWDLGTPTEAKEMAIFLKKETPLPGEVEYPDYPRQAAYKKGSWIAFPLRFALLWVFCVTIWGMIAFLTKWFQNKPISQMLYLITVSAGMVQGAYLSTALVQSGIPRFFLVMWPVIALIGISSLWYIFKKMNRISDKK
jgi:hypothetical protein